MVDSVIGSVIVTARHEREIQMMSEIEPGAIVNCHSNHEPWEGGEVLSVSPEGYAQISLDGDVFEEHVRNLRPDTRNFDASPAIEWVD
jgi:hypothetical protein